MTYNLASLLENSAQNYPERDAIVFPATGPRLTYAEVTRSPTWSPTCS